MDPAAPGPLDPSVLTMQANHRSIRILFVYIEHLYIQYSNVSELSKKVLTFINIEHYYNGYFEVPNGYFSS